FWPAKCPKASAAVSANRGSVCLCCANNTSEKYRSVSGRKRHGSKLKRKESVFYKFFISFLYSTSHTPNKTEAAPNKSNKRTVRHPTYLPSPVFAQNIRAAASTCLLTTTENRLESDVPAEKDETAERP